MSKRPIFVEKDESVESVKKANDGLLCLLLSLCQFVRPFESDPSASFAFHPGH
jgi:hypothetical protein